MAKDKEISWIPFNVAKWAAGTAFMDWQTEYVFFRLVLYCYLNETPNIRRSENLIRMHCRVPEDVYRQSIEVLAEMEKIVISKDGIFVPSTAWRLEEAFEKLAPSKGRQIGAAKARRRKDLKAEGVDDAKIDKIISREFPDTSSDDQADHQPTQRERQTNRETDKEKSLMDLPTDSEIAVSMWNDFAEKHDLSAVRLPLSDRRAKALTARLKEIGGVDGWKTALKKVTESDFLMGRKNDFRAHFNFLCQKKSMENLMADDYKSHRPKGGPRGGGSGLMDEVRGKK